jgi:hypothetical protein
MNTLPWGSRNITAREGSCGELTTPLGSRGLCACWPSAWLCATSASQDTFLGTWSIHNPLRGTENGLHHFTLILSTDQHSLTVHVPMLVSDTSPLLLREPWISHHSS